MSDLRSPNCPAISLREALEKGRLVYNQEHTHPASREVIAADLGYSGLSGPSTTLIGALRQYGILEGRGEMRITDDAVSVFELPDDSQERQQAMVRMAFRPQLFLELHNQFGDRLPGDANLRHFLIRKGFLPERATDVINTFRENLGLVGSAVVEYDGEQEEEQEMMPTPPAEPKIPTPVTASSLAPAPSNLRQDVFSLTEGPVTIQWPATLSPESFQDLGDWLDIVKRKIGRSVADVNQSQSEK